MGLYYTDDKWDTDQQLSKADLRIEMIKSGLHIHSTPFTIQIAKGVVENDRWHRRNDAIAHLNIYHL